MSLDFLRADKAALPRDPWLTAWADRFDALLAGGLAGVDAETLAAALCRLVDDIIVRGGGSAAHDRLEVHGRRLRQRPVPADHAWVADQMALLHAWLARALVAEDRRQAA